MEPLRFNNLEVRLANTDTDVEAAQKLRYTIFHQEMGAHSDSPAITGGRDTDPFDEFCDHLLVLDLERGTRTDPCVVGTYRLLRGNVAKATAGFYSESEFDLGPLQSFPGEIMELGRSCIDAKYRRRGAMQLLWRGIAEYISLHAVDIMFGCGSLHGTVTQEARRALAYLHHFHTAPDHIQPRALAHRYIPMNNMPLEAIDRARALSELPPLLKGYLRLGGYVGDGAVIDYDFNTIDVCVVVETQNVAKTYVRHFTKGRNSFAPQRDGVAAA